MPISRLTPVAALLMLASCGYSARQETPAYFNSVTGLKICDGATVRNRHTAETDSAGIGVVYVVSLKMSAACETDFLRQVQAMRQRLQPHGYPVGPDDSWISVERAGDKLLVTYTT